MVTDLNSCNCFSEASNLSFWNQAQAVGKGEFHDLTVLPSPSNPPLCDNGSHLGCCRFEPWLSVTPTVLSACDIPKCLGPAGLAKNAAGTKINLPHSLAAPCPFPLSSHPSSQQSLPGKAKRGRAGRRKPVLLANPWKERERGREEEKEREITLYGNVHRQCVAMPSSAAEVRYQTDGRN